LPRLAAGIALCAFLVMFVAGCGDDGDASPGPTRVAEGTIVAELPPQWPGDFPVLPGARFIEAVIASAAPDASMTGIWRTDATVDEIVAFFDTRFEEGPWVSAGAGDLGGYATWVARKDGAELQALVSVIEHTSGDEPREIVVILGPVSE